MEGERAWASHDLGYLSSDFSTRAPARTACVGPNCSRRLPPAPPQTVVPQVPMERIFLGAQATTDVTGPPSDDYLAEPTPRTHAGSALSVFRPPRAT